MEELVFTPDAGAKLRSTSERDVPHQVLDELLAKYAGRCPMTTRLASTLAVVKAQMTGAPAASAAETFAVELIPRALLDCAVTYVNDIDAVVPVWDYGGVRGEPLMWEPPAPWRLFAVSHSRSVYLMLASRHPDGALRLRRAPFANVYDDGRVCTGAEVAAVPENPLCDAPVLEHHAQAVYSLMVNAYNSDLASAAARCGHVCRWEAGTMEQKADDRTNDDVASLIEAVSVLAPNFPDAVFDAVNEILRDMHGATLSGYWMMSLPGLLKNGGPVLASMRRDARRFVTGETNPEEDDATPEPEEDDDEDDAAASPSTETGDTNHE